MPWYEGVHLEKLCIKQQTCRRVVSFNFALSNISSWGQDYKTKTETSIKPQASYWLKWICLRFETGLRSQAYDDDLCQ
jgi:hypothetical protein